MMEPTPDPIPGVTGDPVIRLLLSGEARNLHEAEEKYLNSAMPEILELIGGSMSAEELVRHPLMILLVGHGSGGWRDWGPPADPEICRPDIVVNAGFFQKSTQPPASAADGC